MEEAILLAAGDGPVRLDELAQRTGMSRVAVRRALGRAGWIQTWADGRGHRGPRVWVAPARSHVPTPRATAAPKPPPAPKPARNPLSYPAPLPPPPKPATRARTGSLVRVAIPDSHGHHIDVPARDAFLADLRRLDVDEVVWLGDHLDAGGTFSDHQRSYTNEMTESYHDDAVAANELLDRVMAAAPRASHHYIEGNHEQHVERWAAREFASQKDAERMLEVYGPEAVLQLRRRGVRYYRRSEQYMGLSVPGTIRLGKCFFTHGIVHSKNAASVHVERFGGNVVFGHIHRSQSHVVRTVTSDAQGAWSPGTLARLQPLWRHTSPSDWSHGYHLQFVNASGSFLPINVPIYGGKSALADVVDRVRG